MTKKTILLILSLSGVFTLSLNSAYAQSNCDRECLKGFADAFFESMANNDLDDLPLADGYKFTENGAVMAIEDSLWSTAGELTYRMDIADRETGGTAVSAVVKEGNKLVLYMLRLKIEALAITEIETLMVRDGDSDPIWEPANLTSVSRNFRLAIRPVEQNSRYELIAAAEKYWYAFETNGTEAYRPAPFLPTTIRSENGVTTTNAEGIDTVVEATASEQFDSGRYPNRRIFDRRYPVVDTERGVVLSLVRFGHQEGGLTPNIVEGGAPMVAEFFQVQSGKIIEVQVVMNFTLMEADSSGW